MLTKNEVKKIVSLKSKKFRKKEKRFIVEGERLVEEALKSHFSCALVIATNDFADRQKSFLKGFSGRIERVASNEFNRLTDTVNPQGILAVMEVPNERRFHLEQNIIALENISDPGNLGTILRTCDWFGFPEVLLSSDCADIYNPKVVRASMGAIFHLNIVQSENFSGELMSVSSQGYKIITADLDGSPIDKVDFGDKFILVFANEANGPSGQLLSLSDQRVTIPKFGQVESLNVGSAAAALLGYLKLN